MDSAMAARSEGWLRSVPMWQAGAMRMRMRRLRRGGRLGRLCWLPDRSASTLNHAYETDRWRTDSSAARHRFRQIVSAEVERLQIGELLQLLRNRSRELVFREGEPLQAGE